jgi:ring-1,2-phenylacetyl-CoA epoxidase subunit PaaB
VPKDEIGEVDESRAAFGGTTNKGYRWATQYNITAAAEEVADSESEQAEAEKERGRR